MKEINWQLNAIVESSDDAIISKSLDGVITSWNKAAEKIFGYSEDEIIGKPILTIIPEERYGEEKKILKKIAAGERIAHFETIRKTKNGRLIPISLTISPIKDSQNHIIGASKIARDISDKKKAERKREMLAALVDSSDDAIIARSKKGLINSWNRGAEIMFGHSKEEMLGKQIDITIPTEQREKEKALVDEVIQGRKAKTFETVRITKEGHRLPVSLTISPIENSRGNIIGASTIVRDISEQVQIRKQLQLLNQELIKYSNYRDQFIGMASHELKTPITVIKTNLELLDLKAKNGDMKALISKTLSNIDKLTVLITDLLDVSRLQAGELQPVFKPFNFGELLQETIRNVQLTNETHRIILKDTHGDITVYADKNRIEQVIVNLLTNAIKYSPQADKVIVTLKKVSEEILLSVSDFGIGIPEGQLEKVFSRFYRVEGLAPSFSGLGIGLYISKNIIEQHGGKIWVESEVNTGSTFRIKLPINQDQKQHKDSKKVNGKTTISQEDKNIS